MEDHKDCTTSITLVSSFQASAEGPTVLVHGERVPVFFNQHCEINGSPAALCILMALLAMGDIKREACNRLATALPVDEFRRVWPWIVRDYLVGADTSDLKQLVRLLSSKVGSSITYAKNGRAAKWIGAKLLARRWTVVGFESERRSLEHWGLVVGYERYGVLRTLYLLDPAVPTPVSEAWNATFDVPNGRPGAFSECGGNTYVARLSGAVSLHWKPHMERLPFDDGRAP
jgi:hypothetical protein